MSMGRTSVRARRRGDTPLELDQIQGNIIGFQKDYQTFLFLRFPDTLEWTQEWLKGVIGDVATGADVLAFNTLFKQIKDRSKREDVVKATWLNVAFTHKGLVKLNASARDDKDFTPAFVEGMRARAEKNGDVGESGPDNWVLPKDGKDRKDIHAVVLIAADSQADLDAEAGRQIVKLTAQGLQLLFKQDGMNRQDEPGHEHFGFRDGISQPGIRDDRVNPPDKLQPGQVRICAGEFVIGYPAQGTGAGAGEDEPDCGGEVTPMPDWTDNGSYLVFRRLRQDVPGFRQSLKQLAKDHGLTEDLLAAKLVGRYRSGAPLEALLAGNVLGANPPPQGSDKPGGYGASADPGLSDPGLLDSGLINDFVYEGAKDSRGRLVPLAAHIRKLYPRDQPVEGGIDPEAKRILRRGIPFGRSYREDAPDTDPEGAKSDFPDDRGLLFLCYQSSIEDKFEFLQRIWANDPVRPAALLRPNTDPKPGNDPIIGQPNVPREFDIPGATNGHIPDMPQWVFTTGGDYFFSPSIEALRRLASGVL